MTTLAKLRELTDTLVLEEQRKDEQLEQLYVSICSNVEEIDCKNTPAEDDYREFFASVKEMVSKCSAV
jgi:hypothetical protein